MAGIRAFAAAITSAAAIPLSVGHATAVVPGMEDTPVQWQLVYSTNFSTGVSDSGKRWFKADDGSDSRYHVDGYDDDGAYFDARGGAAFRQQLDSFQTFRKSFPFGSGGWLTAELSARDANKDGRPDRPPSILTELVGSNPSLLVNEPQHHGGVVVRSTDPLPSQYRVEVRVRTLDFGGQRDGSWDYPDGRINGYNPKGCKTNHPWANAGDFTRGYCKWKNVRTDSNGFYFLSIMDYARPAPHNNIFVHTHRKVVIDGYNRYKWTGDNMSYCNPLTKQYEPYEAGTGNGVNMLFPTAARQSDVQPGTAYVIESQCGLTIDGPLVSAADLRPEMMPGRSYRFAIERDSSGYTLEARGDFAHIGPATLRYHRDFVEDGVPIWHYNQTPEEYDGRFDTTWSYPGTNGTYTDEHVWPIGSAYPDYFMIGDPHTNYYEGRAHIDDIKLFVPAETAN